MPQDTQQGSPQADNQSTNSFDEQRRNPRVPVNFTVEIEGVAEDGTPYSFGGTTESISKSGATVVVPAGQVPVKAGEEVQVKSSFSGAQRAIINAIWQEAGDVKSTKLSIRLADGAVWLQSTASV